MKTQGIWQRISCTTVGLCRMGRDAVAAFLDRAYAAGRPPRAEETATHETPKDAYTPCDADGE